jgi:hypothetical protein
MVEKLIKPAANVVDFRNYQRSRAASISGRCCRHCGAVLGDDDFEDDCSSAEIALQRPQRARRSRRFYAD